MSVTSVVAVFGDTVVSGYGSSEVSGVSWSVVIDSPGVVDSLSGVTDGLLADGTFVTGVVLSDSSVRTFHIIVWHKTAHISNLFNLLISKLPSQCPQRRDISSMATSDCSLEPLRPSKMIY